jgi:hypothetical protein
MSNKPGQTLTKEIQKMSITIDKKIQTQNYEQLQAAADAAACAQAAGCDPIPLGVPRSGGTDPTAWSALGSQIGESKRWLACRDGKPLDDLHQQYDAQIARFTRSPLPAGVEILAIVRQARYLLVRGSAVQAEADLRAAGYPDAFAGSPDWVRLGYIE